MKIKKNTVSVFLLRICSIFLSAFVFSACGLQKVPGGTFTKVYGIKLEVYDDNGEYIDGFSSVTIADDAKLSLNADKRYIVKIGLVQSGGSTPAFISGAADIVWNYDNRAISLKKCNDVETDTSFFIECVNRTATELEVLLDKYSLKLIVKFEN